MARLEKRKGTVSPRAELLDKMYSPWTSHSSPPKSPPLPRSVDPGSDRAAMGRSREAGQSAEQTNNKLCYWHLFGSHGGADSTVL